ncbi:unnamed protein product [Arabis nemorensis]|uniref:Uncharacterized protein n=1 Tax=Arabis nemorensis TaxID=586526 RepID=A0A565C3X3_9BRAS|nr:unnamed protein product [Arabis nemorensis]
MEDVTNNLLTCCCFLLIPSTKKFRIVFYPVDKAEGDEPEDALNRWIAISRLPAEATTSTQSS